jgi:hypothetical protein
MWFLKILLIIVLVLVLLWLFARFATKNIIEYHSNGRLKLEGESFFNRRNGVFKLFDEDGNLIGRWYYEKGEKIKEEFINPTTGKVWKTTGNSEPKVVVDLSNAEQKVLNDKELVLQAVKSKPSNLQYVKSSLGSDLDVVLAAVNQDGCALRYSAETIKKDKVIAKAAVKQCGSALEFVDHSLKLDREVVMEAVKQNGYALKYSDISLKSDREIVLEAVKQDGLAIKYAEQSLKADREVVSAALQQNGYALNFADQSFLTDKSLLLISMNNIPKLTKRIAEEDFLFDRLSESLFIFLIFQNNQDLIRESGGNTSKLKISKLLDNVLKTSLKTSDLLFYVILTFYLALVTCSNIIWNHPWDWEFFFVTIFYGGVFYWFLFVLTLFVAIKRLNLFLKKSLILNFLKSDTLRNTIKPS